MHPIVKIMLHYWDCWIRYLSRFFNCLAHPNLCATLAIDQNSLIITMANGTVLNFGKIQWLLKGHFWSVAKVALSNQKILKGTYCWCICICLMSDIFGSLNCLAENWNQKQEFNITFHSIDEVSCFSDQ